MISMIVLGVAIWLLGGMITATTYLYIQDRKRDWTGEYTATDKADAVLWGLGWLLLPVVGVGYLVRPTRLANLISSKSRKLAQADRLLAHEAEAKKLGDNWIIAFDNYGKNWKINPDTGYAKQV